MNDGPISRFMTAAPHTVGVDQTITFAEALMREHGFRHLPVLKGGKLVGIVSDRDLGLVAGLNEVNPDDTKIEEAMTQSIYRVASTTPLSEVLKEMAANKYGSALIVNGNHIEGIFTTHDAMSLMAAALNG